MKRMIAFLVVLTLAVGLFCGCGKCTDDGGKAALENMETFTVGFDAEFPPYGFLGPDGQPKGFDLDLAKEVAQRNGWKIELKAIEWAAKDAELNSGTIDCIWNGFTITEERKGMYTWSSPYVQNLQYILVRKNSDIKTFADLNGKVVAAQDGSSGAEALTERLEAMKGETEGFAFKDYKLVKDYLTANMMLQSGAVDAVALDSAVANGFVEKSNGAFVILDEPLKLEEYGIGFKKGNTVLRDAVEKTLKEMVKDGTAKKIVDHWAEAEIDNGGDGIDFILKAD